jgi:hypothetical protein
MKSKHKKISKCRRMGEMGGLTTGKRGGRHYKTRGGKKAYCKNKR